MPLVALDRIHHAFGHLPLLEDANLQIEPGERLAVIGRNGSGKSTLLQIISGELAPDRGSVWKQPNLRSARLVQDVPLNADLPVFDIVAGGLGDLRHLVSAYHHAAIDVAENPTDARLSRLGQLQHQLEQHDGWQLEQRVELILSRLRLPADAIVDTLSGGWKRRVLLARTLVSQPDLLLLDEPTNHLDIDAITWLESFLAEYPGTIAFVTHDRAFLQRIATRIVELDRGRLTTWTGDYATFLKKKEDWLANEALQHKKFDKRLADEEAWLRQGVKARRTRNEGRVRALTAMRSERAARRERPAVMRLDIEPTEPAGRLVVEANRATKSFGDKPVVADFSARIMRGDRIGLVGPNGIGKTTLLQLLLGTLAPDGGEIRLGVNVQVAYYDQQREQLDPDRTVADTVGNGNDTVTVNGRTRHLHGYLQDFLFPTERASSPVRALSGGERNRLLLARLFTRAANLLVLDEPTNDLDIETLELLEARLVDWSGTLLLVSHDRTFLDNVVTSTLVFEGEGRIQEYVGGYDDWLRQRIEPTTPVAAPDDGEGKRSGAALADSPRVVRKLSYKERREFDDLPASIEALEAEQREVSATVESPDFYKESPARIERMLARLDEIRVQLDALYERWDALDSRA